MPWQLLMIFQNLLAAVFAIYSRRLALKFKHATIPFNLLTYAVIAASGIIYALLHGVLSIRPQIFVDHIGFFALAGVCFAITNILSYVVFQYVDAAIASLLSTFNIIAAVILATIVLGEGLTPIQIVGGMVLIAGMEVILTINMGRYRHEKLVQAVLLSALAGIFFAFATTIEKHLLNEVPLSTYLVFGWGFQFLGVCAIALLFGRKLKSNFGLLRQAKFYRIALPASLIRMFGGLLFIYSLKLSNNLSIISVLSGLKIILAALLGAYFLKERSYMGRKLEAAGIAMAGIALLYWR
jgi:drug/metabolite transporter (DMT)-like permease